MSGKIVVVLRMLNLLFCVSYATQITEINSTNSDLGLGQLIPDTTTNQPTNQSQLSRFAMGPMTYDEPNTEKVTVKIYYESMCPSSRLLDSVTLVQKLGQFLNITTYPYGNAETETDFSGHYTFQCQHGPKECYGNKLHACVIDALQNNTLAVLFNACMMDYSQKERGSDDEAADVCGRATGLDTTPIKQCANGDRGTTLLKYYGDESEKADFHSVPYILVNGKRSDGDDLFVNVCHAFKNPPKACSE